MGLVVKPSTTQRGRDGEDAAVRLLESNGYHIVARNWRYKRLEIDVIAREDSTYVFVEVKVRRNSTYGAPEEAVNSAKLGRIEEAAQRFLEQRGEPAADWRVDVVALDAPHGAVTSARLIRGAGY